jgi:hypothetical protein
MALHHDPTALTRNRHARICNIMNACISAWMSYAILVLSSCTITLFLLTRVLNQWILPSHYGHHTLTRLSPNERRSFVYHHVAALTKLVIFAWVICPVAALTCGGTEFDTPYITGPSGVMTMGDMIFVMAIFFRPCSWASSCTEQTTYSG